METTSLHPRIINWVKNSLVFVHRDKTTKIFLFFLFSTSPLQEGGIEKASDKNIRSEIAL